MSAETEKKLIMVVDDDIDLLTQTKIFLENAGYSVATADSQEDAEDLLKTIKPDLVVSDLMMENIDGGFSLSYHIKNIDPKIPVIIVTGVTQETGLHFSLNSEVDRSWVKADVILNKPVKYEVLLDEIKKYLTEY